MSRIASCFRVAAVLAFLLAASSALAQPTPTVGPGPVPGPGTWSAAHPIWFDLNGDGVAQSSELMGYAMRVMTGCTQVVQIPSGIPGTGTSSPCIDANQSGGLSGTITRLDGTMQTLSSDPSGTFFTFTQMPYSPPDPTKSGGVHTLAATVSGTGRLLDGNGDGIYDMLQVEGTGLPQSQISLVPRDATGDGRPDYITVPWTTGGAGLLGVFTDTTPQIYFPLTDTDGDGWPDTITVQEEYGPISTTTGPPLSGAALVNGRPIPSTSTLGLFVFAAAVVALGVKLLRGTIAAA